MTQRDPTCSVVVPTRSRPRQLAACLEAVTQLNYPRERLEVIVVDDNGGGDSLASIVDAFRTRLDVTLLVQPGRGPAAARNAAAERARGELLLFTDDDCRPVRDWLRRIAEQFVLNPESGFGGRTVNGLPTNPYATTSQLVITVGYAQNNRDVHDARFFASNNLAFPRAGFLSVGGFDERFTTSEDRDLCARWVLSGRRLTYVPEAVLVHSSELTFTRFWKQFFSYGRGAFRYRRAQAARTGRRVPIEPSFYWALHRQPFSDPSVERRLSVSGLLLVWHLANTAGYLREWLETTRNGGA